MVATSPEVLLHAGPDDVAAALAARLMARLTEIQRDFRTPQLALTLLKADKAVRKHLTEAEALRKTSTSAITTSTSTRFSSGCSARLSELAAAQPHACSAPADPNGSDSE